MALLGAINKLTGEYIHPFFANKNDEYVCPECNRDLILCKGEIKIHHYRHKTDSAIPCNHYSNPGEAQIHKDAKRLIKSILERKIPFSIVRKCVSCETSEEFDIPEIDETSKIMLEYRFEYNGLKIADVAYIENDEIVCIFEICNTHKTCSEDRPEPWFEIDARTLIEAVSNNNDTALKIPCIRCEKCDKCKISNSKSDIIQKWFSSGIEYKKHKLIAIEQQKLKSDQIINEIKSDVECKICFENFVKLTSNQFYKFIDINKDFLPETFEDDNYCRRYEDRFECLICKNIICKDCYWSFKNHKFKPPVDHIEDYKYFGTLDKNGLAEGCPGEDCPIICPFCRTKDYKIFYGNQIPYELLNEIKKWFSSGIEYKKINDENKSRAIDIVYNWFNNGKCISPFYFDEEFPFVYIEKNIKSDANKPVDLILYEDDCDQENEKYEKYHLFLVNKLSECCLTVKADDIWNYDVRRTYYISIEWVLSQTEIPNKIEYIASIDNFDIGKDRNIDCARCKSQLHFWVKRIFTKTDYKIINISNCCGRQESEYVECERCSSLNMPLTEMEKNGKKLCNLCITQLNKSGRIYLKINPKSSGVEARKLGVLWDSIYEKNFIYNTNKNKDVILQKWGRIW